MYYDKVLGQGGYGTVLAVKSKGNNKKLAVKIIDRNKVSPDVYDVLLKEPKHLSKH